MLDGPMKTLGIMCMFCFVCVVLYLVMSPSLKYDTILWPEHQSMVTSDKYHKGRISGNCREDTIHILNQEAYGGNSHHDNLIHAKTCWREALVSYLTFPLDFSFGSHVLPLFASVWVTDGAVCELGSGWFSTPMLHRIAQDQARFLLTADSNAAWLKYFTIFATDFHHLYYIGPHRGYTNISEVAGNNNIHEVDSWADVGGQSRWGLIFIDQAPGSQRYIDLQRLRNQSEIFLVHDTDPQSLRAYKNNGEILDSFKFKYVIGDKWSARHAHVLSDKRGDLVELIGQLCEWGMEILQSTINVKHHAR